MDDSWEKTNFDLSLPVARKIQVYNSELFIEAKLSGLRYYMYHHPYLSGLVGTVTIATFLSILLALNLYRFMFAEIVDDDKMFDDPDEPSEIKPNLEESGLTGEIDSNNLDVNTIDPLDEDRTDFSYDNYRPLINNVAQHSKPDSTS